MPELPPLTKTQRRILADASKAPAGRIILAGEGRPAEYGRREMGIAHMLAQRGYGTMGNTGSPGSFYFDINEAGRAYLQNVA